MKEYAAAVTAILAAVITFLLTVAFTTWGPGKIIFCTFWTFMLAYPAAMSVIERKEQNAI